MIWVGGEVVPEEALAISVLDRTFEHGLGLFETLRTWDGHATLLDRHRERMLASARELGLEIELQTLPDRRAVADLLRADGHGRDALFRITCSGGVADRPATIWMRSSPLPGPMGGDAGAVIGRSMYRIAHGDPLATHKTLNYWPRRLAYQEGRRRGLDEVLIGMSDRGRDLLIEGSRTNLFVVNGGVLFTPEATGMILPGIMRGLVLGFARSLGIETVETAIRAHQAIGTPSGWLECGLGDEVFLTNSVRGIIPVRRALDVDYRAPGPITSRLWESVRNWLGSGGAAA